MGLNEIIKIGDQMRKFRTQFGLTQKDMAQKLNIAHSTYSNYENNNRTPSIEILGKMADILNVDINDFFVINNNNSGQYYEFIDLFIAWSIERGYTAHFSHNDDIFCKNDGGQSILIEKDNKFYEFTPSELLSYLELLYTIFDVKLSLKAPISNADDYLI